MDAVALVFGGYLLGALPFTAALAAASDIDVAAEPDLHIALWHRCGWFRPAVAVVVEIAKGAFPVLIGFGFGLPVAVVALSGTAAVAGQMWPLVHGHGEKGNSVAVGVLGTLLLVYRTYWPLTAFALFAAGAASRYFTLSADNRASGGGDHPLARGLPVGMLLGFAAAPLICRLTSASPGVTLGLLLVFVLIAVRRMTAGLMADLAVGARMGPVLLRRLLFDESLTGRG